MSSQTFEAREVVTQTSEELLTVKAEETLSDPEAFNILKFKIAFAAQAEWLNGQFKSRTPYHARTAEPLNNGKNGHPYLFHPSDLEDLANILDNNQFENYSNNLAFVKFILAQTFETFSSYFEYLDTLTEEQFYSWLENVLKNLYENNSHWSDFVRNLLDANQIDYSDLVEGKLDEVSPESEVKLLELQEVLSEIQNSTDPVELRRALIRSQKLGLLDQIVKAHSEWRKTFYKLESIRDSRNSDSDHYLLEDRYIIKIQDLGHKLRKNKNLTAEEVKAEIQKVRTSFESSADHTAKQTFMTMVGISVSLRNLLHRFRDELTENQRQGIQDAIDDLVRTIKLDANPAPINTVVLEYKEAKRMRKEAQQLAGVES